ncbi:site-specific DNA-methyltransferase [Campylobacter upsaliensis]|uniref:site-specific DNA-methyltransferase n=1 Tax=Campylobacter upsaliensis TaxID=28080 RepID=UPI002B3EDDD5|nr:site-specific DNA-methyltransferase [Campylobacter upsaliensis]MEB2820695.1 site-specific DNA-methyltransferase [Campylobacter upsaliensis]
MPTKQRLTKQDITQAHIIDSTKEHNPLLDYLAKHHPQTISEERLNLDALSQALGFSPSSMQGYGLSFIGKPLANALYSTPTTKELKELDPKHSQNIIIKGDNLHALKLLKSAYDGKIKMIYIDPPYNTKNEKFIYDDNFVKEYQKLLIELDLLKLDSNGKVLEKSEVLHFLTNPSGDKSHSGWLSFMLPRLKLARDLLKDDGVIFISIDDNEQANLKILCDEIFGEENFVACMPRTTKKAGKSTNQIANNHDYVLCYSKNNTSFKQIEVIESDYKEKDEYFDERGGYKLNQTLDYDSLSYSKNGDYEINLNGKKYYAGGSYEKFLKRQNGDFNKLDWVWRWRKDKLEFGLKNGFVEVRNDRIYTKTYFKCKITDKKPYKIEFIDRTKNIASIELVNNKYSNDYANKNLQQIFEQKNIFDYSKSVELLKFLVYQSTNTGGGDIVLDFFAGSGTTAQAVMELNAEDGGNRQFILVQLDEPIDEAKSKVAYDFCKNTLKSQNPVISDITIERVKRAAAKIAKQDLLSAKELDLDFRLFTMVQKPELVSEENDNLRLITHADLSPQDKALNLALQDSKMLHKKLESIIKDKLYQCENSLYIVQMDKEVLDYIKNKTHDEIVYLNAFDDIDLQEYLNLESHLKTRLYVVFQ